MYGSDFVSFIPSLDLAPKMCDFYFILFLIKILLLWKQLAEVYEKGEQAQVKRYS